MHMVLNPSHSHSLLCNDQAILAPNQALIGLGSNQSTAEYGSPYQTIVAALATLATLDSNNCRILNQAKWYRTAPFQTESQPDFVNSAILVETQFDCYALLRRLHEIEYQFGRRRQNRNEPRVLDLDLLAFGAVILPPLTKSQSQSQYKSPSMPPLAIDTELEKFYWQSELTLPHPRLFERAFVLYPLRDIMPNYRHSLSGASVGEMIAALPPQQDISLLFADS